MKTLFSPVGTADPLTQQGDGPMLHIVRHYEPERVVLFLSPKMREFQGKDGRYTEAIRRLCVSEGRPEPVVELIESTYEEVFRFDHYIAEFEEILSELSAQVPGETLLVNTSSGTPGWQQALVTLGSFGRLPLRLLQVTTPRKGINSRQDRESPTDYDLDTLWELNEELRREDPEARKPRIIEVATPNFSDRLVRENVATLVTNYEYEAACELVSKTSYISGSVSQMILAARDRLNLNGALPAKVFSGTTLAYRPNDLLGEYLSVMEVRLAQGHWADFVRMLTPALTHLAKVELRKSGLPEQRYLSKDEDGELSVLRWDVIGADERLRRVFGSRRISLRPPKYVENWMLIDLLHEYCENAASESKLTQLRDFESKCRNKLAHTLCSSSRESLERLGGLHLDTVLRYLFELHGSMRPHLYADISRLIVENL